MPTTLTLPPATPIRTEGPTAFNAKAGPFVDWLVTFTTQMNTVIGETAASTANALAYSISASSAATSASGSAISAASSASSILGAVTTCTNAQTVTVQAKNDTLSAIAGVAINDDWGLVTEAVTATNDWGTL